MDPESVETGLLDNNHRKRQSSFTEHFGAQISDQCEQLTDPADRETFARHLGVDGGSK
ncbi:Uncharacterised protein [Mycobacterium tuberculosis]|nr:Uncharacterised protein [Mycobacterium tuberculosis]